MEKINVKCGRINTEGDELFYKVRGSGKPIIFIAPGGGNGDNYLELADLMANNYKIITYDRRANARSTRNFPNEFTIEQQSRDVIAIIKAVNEEKAFVFGNSSGGVIALDLVSNHSDYVLSAFVHEAPVANVHPKKDDWKMFFQSCYDLAKEKGASAGAKKFFFGIQMPAIALILATIKSRKYEKHEITLNDLTQAELKIKLKDATDVLVLNELIPVTGYVPDIEKLKKNKSKIIIGRGEYGIKKKTWYAEVSEILSKHIECDLVTCPTHHGSFMDKPKEWAVLLKKYFK